MTRPASPEGPWLVVARGPEEVARVAACLFVNLAGEAIQARGRCAVALSGGSTPKGLYHRLASPGLAGRLDWTRVHLFWGDERCVPPDHPESNFRLARETLLDHLPIPADNIRRIPAQNDPAAAAEEYETCLRRFFGSPETTQGPRHTFDLLLLGMGEDGHTASLFPGSPALYETERWAKAQFIEKLDAWRITLTPVAINAARHVLFLATGDRKAEPLARALRGPFEPEKFPAQIVDPHFGQVHWVVDMAAASRF